ncbi:MAG: glycosyltransferase family 2 protein [Bacteroidetes bacterium]|nr:glycosyltransferase family 2 protein [Bacteroidota bacterium]
MSDKVSISVVIPCRNEANYIADCIEHIFQSNGLENMDLRVFVVDGMSDDGTRAIIAEEAEKNDRVKLIDNIHQLTPYAFNLGIYAGGKVDFVQIVGARHMISPNYLETCLKRLNDSPDVWCVGGQIKNEFINETGEIIAAAMGTAFGMGLGNFRTLEKSGYTDTVTSPMYPYAVFDKIGFFDEQLIRNQDDDFNYRVTKAGGKIYYEHDISLRYFVRGSFSSLWRQFYQYGYWKVFVNQKHKAVTTIRQLVPPLFAFYLLLVVLTSLLQFGSFPSFRWPLYLYIILTLYFSYKTSLEKKVPFVGLIQTFPILHVSYGLGYLKGIWTFIIQKQKPQDKQKRMSR